MKKYEFTGETKNNYGVTLKQIRALVTIIGVVSSGDVGGWVESEKCLDHGGDAWVYGDALVYGNALVYGDAQVYGNARVYGNALVYGNARVCGDALVYGNARVCGNALVESLESICSFSGFGSEYRTTTAFVDKELGIRIVCGCFTGTIDQFRSKVIETHGSGSKNGSLYLYMANMIEKRLVVSEQIKEAA